jgi:hypothetical protein
MNASKTLPLRRVSGGGGTTAAWLLCFVPVLLVAAVTALPPPPGSREDRTALEDRIQPPPETRRFMEKCLAVNGPITGSRPEFSCLPARPWLCGDGQGRLWVADWSPPPPAGGTSSLTLMAAEARVICEERTGALLVFSGRERGTTAADRDMTFGPLRSKERALQAAQWYLRYFRRTEWCASPFVVTAFPEQPETQPIRNWRLTAHNGHRVLIMRIDAHTGALIFLSTAARASDPPKQGRRVINDA